MQKYGLYNKQLKMYLDICTNTHTPNQKGSCSIHLGCGYKHTISEVGVSVCWELNTQHSHTHKSMM